MKMRQRMAPYRLTFFSTALVLAGAALLTRVAAAPQAAIQTGSDKGRLRAGAFAQDITPRKFPISVNGGFQDRQAVRANDPLYARCLVLDNGQSAVALVVVDSCMIPREIVDAAKAQAARKTGIPPENMLISATHTHTAPTVAGVFQSEPDPEYVQFLTERLAEGIIQAHSRLQPARVAWGVAEEPRQVFNRRWKMKAGVLNRDPFGNTTDQVRTNPPRASADLLEPAGPTDPRVTVLSVQTAQGEPLALYANYSLHYVGDLPPLSADYFGVFAGVIAGKLKAGPSFVAMLSNGTSGDINNINFREPAPKRQPGEQSRLVAEAVAEAALRAVEKASYRHDVPLAALQQQVRLQVRKPTPQDVRRAEDILSRAKEKVLRNLEEVYARETVLLARYPDAVTLPLQVIRVGEGALVAIPCEVFVEIGLELKRTSPFPITAVVSLANGYYGYLPTPEQHALGGYETWRARSSYLEVSASRTITQTLQAMLRRLASAQQQ
ncbi:MAG: hypothetical protein NZU63_10940 [Gemmataceae bacterium]|nr:hypothetical protein [Gemmataceae bacterium]MDW8244444.1 hypothetical protein [Thermogemmata sp.]